MVRIRWSGRSRICFVVKDMADGNGAAGSDRMPSVAYAMLILAVSYAVGAALEIVRVRGGFVYPERFPIFRILFFVQFGLFGGAVLSFLLFLLLRLRVPGVVSATVIGGFYLWCAWLGTWGLTQSAYGIELTARALLELFSNPVAFGAMGLQPREFGIIAVAAVVLVAGLTVTTLLIARRATGRVRKIVCLTAVVLFLAVHIPVRAYFVYHINRGSHVTLAYDDCLPLALRSEYLFPGLRIPRVAIPNLEDRNRTKAYFDFVRSMPIPAIPQPTNILWINIESFRADAISERVMPRLFALRDRFQIRLDQNFWSGGNATQFGIFSMLTGLSGAHYGECLRAKAPAPFLRLLERNNYRLRVASGNYMQYGGLFRLLPASTVSAHFSAGPRDQGDVRMVDLYLEDRARRSPSERTFDFLPLDATHWPYFYPDNSRRFAPDALVSSSRHVLRGETDLASIRNRYDNACNFVDEQISRVLENLEAAGEFERTIIIIVGDHGEEFQERGQITHSAALNDFQGRTVLWMHLPDQAPALRNIDNLSVGMDIVPTLLHALGFEQDVLYTQGRSLLASDPPRRALSLSEQGFTVPLYRAVVSSDYISRWWQTPERFLFSGVQRRDGKKVEGDDWLREVRELTPEQAHLYEVLPDTARPPRPFEDRQSSQPEYLPPPAGQPTPR